MSTLIGMTVVGAGDDVSYGSGVIEALRKDGWIRASVAGTATVHQLIETRKAPPLFWHHTEQEQAA